MTITFHHDQTVFEVRINDFVIIRHTPELPFLVAGIGNADIQMYRGNFDITDAISEKAGLTECEALPAESGFRMRFFRTGLWSASVWMGEESGRFVLKVESVSDHLNRFWLRLLARPEEKIYGCGEQFSYFNLRGRHFPLWTSEQGVGRNKKTMTTFLADQNDNCGGDYYWTFFPQPTFVSTEKYYCHVDNSAYMDFDFSHPGYHELQIWDSAITLILETADSWPALLHKLTGLLGRQPEMPDWVYDGLILGIQGGTDICLAKLKTMQAHGVKVSAIWAQDWQGPRITSFGRRLMWNWEWDSAWYPRLDQVIPELKAQGIRFMGYINPYVTVEGNLFREANAQGFLGLTPSGEAYQVDFGEFYAGIVDLTNPAAFSWYKSVIRKNLIDLGLGGWMADFGEYLPTDVVLHNGVSAMLMHNAWPALWAQCNYEAVAEAGKQGEIVFFMRAGSAGSQRYSHLMWAGDQNVDWSMDDGLASVIPASLSMGMTGHGLHHSDIGGYTTLYGMKRDKELLLRWADFAAFTPIMRTHEGNRPGDNWQFDSDLETILHLKRMTDVYTLLSPYIKQLVRENAESGIPVMRPLFMHFAADAASYDQAYQYLLGADVLVAPVHQPGVSEWTVYLPPEEWVHVWTGKTYSGGTVTVNAPLGAPPVFYRKQSEYRELFASMK